VDSLIAGDHELRFDASGFSSGIYFYGLIADGTLLATRKMMYIR